MHQPELCPARGNAGNRHLIGQHQGLFPLARWKIPQKLGEAILQFLRKSFEAASFCFFDHISREAANRHTARLAAELLKSAHQPNPYSTLHACRQERDAAKDMNRQAHLSCAEPPSYCNGTAGLTDHFRSPPSDVPQSKNTAPGQNIVS